MTENAIRLPAWVSSGMVFQHGVPFLLNGYAPSRTSIKLEVIKEPTDGRKVSKLDTDYGIIWKKEARADEDGMFSFELPQCKPSTDAYSLLFYTSEETVAVKDLRCGDVWLMLGSVPFCTPISEASAPRTPLKDSALHTIRFFVSSRTGLMPGERYSYSPASTLGNFSWITVKDAEALAEVSAVGFSLAYHLADQLHYPVGIIDLALAGSSIISWISRQAFESDLGLCKVLKNKHLFADENDWARRGTEISAESPSNKPADNKAEKLLDTAQERLMTALYNHKLFPLRNMSIRGVLYAPDAKDSNLSDQYESLFTALLSDLAELFGPKKIKSRDHIPSLILLHVHPIYTDDSDPYGLVHFNESITAIRRKLPMPIGILSQHDMLIKDKAMTFYLGRHLSYIALGLHYTPKMPTSSPECTGVEIIGNKVMISFDNTSDGLKLAENESVLRGFAICGEDKVYRPAQARILHGVRVMVWHDAVPVPKGVTYGYYPVPQCSTFRNRADLPVLPFRFDRSPAAYAPDLTFASCDQLTIIGLQHKDSSFALLPVYEILKGTGKIFLENLNKTEGSGSLRIEYIPSEGYFSFAPILRYASMYAPIDLSSFTRICVDVFNPDQHSKKLVISGFESSAVIKTGLMWQTLQLTYEESKPMKISSLEIGIMDGQKKGSVYIDNIRFLP